MRYALNGTKIVGILYKEEPNVILDTNINFGLDQYINGQVVKASAGEVAMQNAQAESKMQVQQCLDTLKKWFAWYDNQVSQAQRAQRIGSEWHASDGQKTYNSLAELDADANAKQNQIRALSTQAH